MKWMLLLILVACGGQVNRLPDGGLVPCRADGPFNNVRPVPGLERVGYVSATFASDELSAYVALDQGTCPFCTRIYVVRRASKNEPFGAPELVDFYEPAPGVVGANGPSLSGDGLELYFRGQNAAPNEFGLRVSRRKTIGDTFGRPELPPGLPDLAVHQPFLTRDHSQLFYLAGGIVRHSWIGNTWTEPHTLQGLPPSVAYPVVSADNRTLYFVDTSRPYEVSILFGRLTGDNVVDITAVSGAFNQEDTPTWISSDHCRLYIARYGQGIWVASRD